MKKLFFLLFASIILNTTAQPILGISRVMPINMNDTVMAGGTYVYDVLIENRGNQTFLDSFSIYTAVVDSFFGYNVVSTYNSNALVTILPGDTLVVSLTETYNLSPLGYKTGIDVIVVWPIATSAATADSLMFELFILDPTAIHEFDLQKMLKLYPNPSSDKCTIDLLDNTGIKAVRLFDISGKEYPVIMNGTTIHLQHLAEGYYIIDVELQNNKHAKAKFIKK